HLKELDLSYNHPGDSAGGLLSAALVDPTDKLMKLNVDHGGEFRLKSGLRKYACHLTLDPNTANPNLILSEGNRKVTRVEEKQHYEDHPDRFDRHPQVLCREGLSGSRYYWEVERGGDGAYIGVAYKGMKRKGEKEDSWIGANRKSWGLFCSMTEVITFTMLESVAYPSLVLFLTELECIWTGQLVLCPSIVCPPLVH
ncbi:hypothetical protein J4Q44_G00037760, partial [Coregonus suidteri]